MNHFSALFMTGLAFAAATVTALPTAAYAERTPSTEDMINSLALSDVAKPCAASGCRGIRAMASPEPTSRAGYAHIHRAALNRETTQQGGGVLDLTVRFATGSASLTPDAEALLARLGHALQSQRLAGDHFRIEGHTDTVGGDDLNQALSDERAASVAAFLKTNFGIDAARLQAIGMGKQGLAVPTADQTPEARNRRVHIVNLGA
jgi:outer membrane protein OmpA-like peptidoglycan-associated protein